MTVHRIAPTLCATVLLAACGGGDGDRAAPTFAERAARDEVTAVASDDAAMREAIARARGSVDAFLDRVRAPSSGQAQFSIKLGLEEGGQTEYVWLSDLRVQGDRWSGTLDNTPRWVTRVRKGERLEFGRGDIVDWTYVDTGTGRMHGNFTTCALLTHEPLEQADAYMRRNGLVCD